MDESWLKQDDKPLFDDVLWSKPERKTQAGKLLIVGGHLHGFDQAALAYQNAVEAGIGEVKVILPDKLKPVLGRVLDNAVFAPSTNSGTLASDSPLASYADWADSVLLIQTGDNSQTSQLLTNFILSSDKPLIITDEILNAVQHDLARALRPPLLAILTLAGLQNLFKSLGAEYSLRHDMGLRPLVQALLGEGRVSQINLATVYQSYIVVAADSRVVTTDRAQQPQLAALAARLAVWWTWQPNKTLQALATAAYEF